MNTGTKTKSYNGLAISSGGYKGLSFVGALVPLELNGYLSKVRRYAGCSVGSVICLLLAVGWKPIEMARRAINVKLFNGLGDVDINEFKTNFGIMSNQSLRDELENLVLDKRKTLPTLLDLHNEGIYIAFSICDRRTKTGHKIDYKSHPTLLATEGSLMSSNIPFVFPPIEFEGMKIIDGALCNPFPVDYLDNGIDKVLGLVVYGESNNDESSFVAYTTGTIMIQIEEMQRVITKHASKACDILEVFVGDDVSVLDTNCAYAGKLQMFLNGIEDGKLFIRALHKRERRAKRKNSLNNNSKKQKEDKQDLHKNIYEKIARNNTPIRNFPDGLLVKCLMSQPVDILCQAAMTSNKIINEVRMNSIAELLTMLPAIRLERLKVFARVIIQDEIDKLKDEYDPTSHIKVRPKNEFVSTSPRSRANSKRNTERDDNGRTVNIKENYSQKFYDSLPNQFKSLAKSVVEAIGEEKANTTILGINIILEGLNRLGLNPLEGGFLTEPTMGDGFYNYDENDHVRNDNNKTGNNNKKSSQSRVEIIPEEEEGIQEALDQTDVVIDITDEERERQRTKNPTDAVD